MKRNFIKLFMLPVAAFFLASAAAVSTDKSHESKAATLVMDGFIHNPTINDCEPELNVQCEVGSGDPCEVGSWIVYGTTGIGCSVELKRVQ
jgi:hypothetical protein